MVPIEIALLHFRFTAQQTQKTARARDRRGHCEDRIEGHEKLGNKIEQDPK
jgi:hypothetical protein